MVEQHFRPDPLAGLNINPGAHSVRLGALALGQGHDLAPYQVVFTDEQRLVQHAQFLVGKKADHRLLDRELRLGVVYPASTLIISSGMTARLQGDEVASAYHGECSVMRSSF